MADPILIPIPDLPPAPGTWDLPWPLAIADPTTKKSYRLTGSEFGDKLIQYGAFADVRPDKFYVCGRGNLYDPAPGDIKITDPTLAGYQFEVKLRGVEELIPGDNWSFDPVGNSINFFSLDPENPGSRLFNAGDVVIVRFYPKISSIVAAPGSIGKKHAGVVRFTASGNILSTMYQKQISIVSVATPVTVILPDGNDYPKGVMLTITTNLVNTYQSTIQTFAGQKIYLSGTTKEVIWLGVNEQVDMFWDDSNPGFEGWYVDYISPSFLMVGQIVHAYVQPMNTLPLIGGTFQSVQYPRADDLITRLDILSPAAVVDDATWNSDPLKYRGLFSTGPSAGVRRLPDLRGMYIRTLDQGRNIDKWRNLPENAIQNLQGGYEPDMLLRHNHNDGPFDRLVTHTGVGTVAVTDSDDPSGTEPDLTQSRQMLPVGADENTTKNTGLPAFLCV